MLENLNKEFESRVRLGIMSVLMINQWIEFKEMKSLLNVTDGNLASHSNTLEKVEYIEIKKEFVGKKTKTSFKATKKGKNAFELHLKELEKIINKQK